MKDIKNFVPEKYLSTGSSQSEYTEVEPGIYMHQDDGETLYATSLSLGQEPEEV